MSSKSKYWKVESLWQITHIMGLKGVKKLSRKIFKCFSKRDGDLWRSYEDAYKNDNDFLAELGKFLNSYKKCLNQIKGGRIDDGHMRILEKLKTGKGASDRIHNQHFVDQILVEKADRLMTQQVDFLKVLKDQLRKPRKKYRTCKRFLKVVTHILFIGVAAAEFACTIVAAVVAAPLVALAIAAVIIPTLAGQHWTVSWIEDCNNPIEYSIEVIRSMQGGIVAANLKLTEIKACLGSADVNIESLLSHLSSIEGDSLDIENIECRLKKIHELEEKSRIYKSQISENREKVSARLRA